MLYCLSIIQIDSFLENDTVLVNATEFNDLKGNDKSSSHNEKGIKKLLSCKPINSNRLFSENNPVRVNPLNTIEQQTNSKFKTKFGTLSLF